MPDAYRTPVEAARVSPHGWAQIPNGRWVPRLPFMDARWDPAKSPIPLPAILDYETQLAVAAREGARIISPDTAIVLNETGFRLEPEPLPDDDQVAEHVRRFGPCPPPPRTKTEPPSPAYVAWQSQLRAPMGSLEWVERHAAKCWRQLVDREWDGILPVFNFGKLWVSGALAGRSRIFGWSKSRSSRSLLPYAFDQWLQPLQNAHNRKHADYGTLAMFERDTPPEA